MNWTDLPVVSFVSETGPEDPIFDSLLLVGPLVILSIVVLGRSILTQAIVGAYIAIFVVYVAYQGVQSALD